MRYRSCGYFCFPASEPGDGRNSYDCAHSSDAHYSIDGEAVGCELCEEAEENREPDPDRGDYKAIDEQIVKRLF